MTTFVRRDLRAAVVPWVVGRVLVVGALALSRHVYSKIGAPPRPIALGQGLFAWDAAYYRDIAEHGYGAVGHGALRFFPLVPLLARALGTVFLDHTAVALIVVVNVAALAFAAALHRLALRETGDAGVARRAAWFAALFPAATVLVLGYAEGPAMLLAVGVLLAIRSRRWGWAAVAGLLAGLCRPIGVLLVLPVFVEAVRAWGGISVRERWARAAAVVSPLVGTGLYLGWAGLEFGDAWRPISLQDRATLRGGFQDPFSRTFDALRDLVHGHHASAGIHVVWAAFFAVLLVVLARRLPASYWLYGAAALVLALSAKNLDSLERYCMSAFPFLLALALVTERQEVERAAIVLAAGGLVGYATLAFLGVQGP